MTKQETAAQKLYKLSQAVNAHQYGAGDKLDLPALRDAMEEIIARLEEE